MAFDLSRIQYLVQDNKEAITYFAIFFLLFIVIYMVLKRTFMKDNKEQTFAALIALIISGIGVWYLSNTQFMSIIQTYAALGIIILFFIPLMIILAAMHNVNSTPGIRRVVVALYGIVSYYVITSNEIEITDQSIMLGLGIILFAMIFDSAINKMLSKQTSGAATHP